jgi:hypothetical protein
MLSPGSPGHIRGHQAGGAFASAEDEATAEEASRKAHAHRLARVMLTHAG